jgi:hypothetical protein
MAVLGAMSPSGGGIKVRVAMPGNGARVALSTNTVEGSTESARMGE